MIPDEAAGCALGLYLLSQDSFEFVAGLMKDEGLGGYDPAELEAAARLVARQLGVDPEKNRTSKLGSR